MQIIPESCNDFIVCISYISYISCKGFNNCISCTGCKDCIVILRRKMKQCQVLNTLTMSS